MERFKSSFDKWKPTIDIPKTKGLDYYEMSYVSVKIHIS